MFDVTKYMGLYVHPGWIRQSLDEVDVPGYKSMVCGVPGVGVGGSSYFSAWDRRVKNQAANT